MSRERSWRGAFHSEFCPGSYMAPVNASPLVQEETLDVEYIESVMPPQKMSSIPQDDWVSDVSCALPGWVLLPTGLHHFD